MRHDCHFLHTESEYGVNRKKSAMKGASRDKRRKLNKSTNSYSVTSTEMLDEALSREISRNHSFNASIKSSIGRVSLEDFDWSNKSFSSWAPTPTTSCFEYQPPLEHCTDLNDTNKPSCEKDVKKENSNCVLPQERKYSGSSTSSWRTSRLSQATTVTKADNERMLEDGDMSQNKSKGKGGLNYDMIIPEKMQIRDSSSFHVKLGNQLSPIK